MTRASEHAKAWGQFFTPAPLVEFMAALPSLPLPCPLVRILDPGAGKGALGLALAERVLAADPSTRVELVAVEAEPRAHASLTRALAQAQARHAGRLRAHALADDFLDATPERLGEFDLAIANPPYFKLSPRDPRGGGAPNIYARFMAISASLLRMGGQLCFLVPRSYASGRYFRSFRRRFHASMRLDCVHLFESRKAAFRADAVLQENLVALYTKHSPDAQGEGEVRVTSSVGLDDLGAREPLLVPRRDLASTTGDALLSLPTSAADLRLARALGGWTTRLADLGLEVSTGPVVAFRSTAALVRGQASRRPTAPLLWLQHVRAGEIAWPLGAGFRKPERIRVDLAEPWLVPTRNYVLIRRFSAKEDARRITAAAFLAKPFLTSHHGCDRVGFENHLNYIHRPAGAMSETLALGLAAVLNSTLLDRYFRISSGNTQVSASELREIPLPSPAFLERLGRRARLATPATLDALLDAELALAPALAQAPARLPGRANSAGSPRSEAATTQSQ